MNTHKKLLAIAVTAALLFALPCHAEILLLKPGESLKGVLAGAAATTNPTYIARTARGVQAAGSFNDTTAVTLASGATFEVDQVVSVHVYNVDTAAVSITFTLDTTADVTLAKVTLNSGDMLRWDASNGIRVINSSGQVQQGAAAIGGTGAAAGTGVVATENGVGRIHTTTLTLTNTPVVLVDEAGVVAYGGLKVYDLPEGAIQFLGAVTDLDLTLSAAGVNADWDGDVGLGTVTASNNNSLASTEQNILPTTATPQAVASATTANGQSTITEAGIVINGTTTAGDVYLNLLVDDADHDVTSTPTNILCNGTIKLVWVQLGDY